MKSRLSLSFAPTWLVYSIHWDHRLKKLHTPHQLIITAQIRRRNSKASNENDVHVTITYIHYDFFFFFGCDNTPTQRVFFSFYLFIFGHFKWSGPSSNAFSTFWVQKFPIDFYSENILLMQFIKLKKNKKKWRSPALVSNSYKPTRTGPVVGPCWISFQSFVQLSKSSAARIIKLWVRLHHPNGQPFYGIIVLNSFQLPPYHPSSSFQKHD